PVDSLDADAGYVGAELNLNNVLDVEFLDSLDDLICILSDIGMPLYCNKEIDKQWHSLVLSKIESGSNKRFNYDKGNIQIPTTYWSIFLESYFQIEQWTVVKSDLSNIADQSINNLRLVLFIVAFLTVALVIIFTLPIIRSRVLPLEKILDATKKLAAGEFQTKIDIKSNDEFQQIGDAFNHMTTKLEEVFEHQHSLSVIGAQLLSSDTAKLVFRNIHRELIKLSEIDAVGIVYFETEKHVELAFYYPIAQKPSHKNELLLYRDVKDIPHHSWTGTGQEIIDKYSFLTDLEPKHTRDYILVPIMIDTAPIAVIAIEANESDDNLIAFTEQIADIASNALNKIILARELLYQANHDALTDLPNRLLFNDRLEHAIQKSRRENTIFGVLFFDLNRFKEINDSLGHTIGDELLKIVAHRLEVNLRQYDTLSRLGGDEFIIIAEVLDTPDGAGVLAEKLKRVVEQPYYCSGNELFVTTSIGISVYPRDGEDPETLVRNADAAMYLAKQDGSAPYQFYSPELTERALDRVQMEKNLRNGITKSQFHMVYQPQYCTKTQKIVGIESLIRWEHPDLGFIPPDVFIPVAEDTGIINELGSWILETVCRQIVFWNNTTNFNGVVAVNISAKQLRNENLIISIKNILKNTGCKPEWLELEVTESYFMADPQNAINKLQLLNDMGIRLSVDDFGTGYSSLNYLKHLPIHTLKIDRTFIKDLPNSKEDIAIAKTIITLGKNMGLSVIAEGVETEEQKEFLKMQGCDTIQGYYFAKPMLPDEISFD
ncbi:MAG: EAL domain-containing protein, partial [Gammaproteobacteria bacterium]|nr:EAL domain-containing protein [Gammaproteobacteria bacterium]